MQSDECSVEDETPVTLEPNPFDLARIIQQRVRESAAREAARSRDIIYLWIHVSSEGIAQPQGGRTDNMAPPTLDDWLNVVDEASGLGANWIVVTTHDSFSDYPEVWEICSWAQTAHEMKVGLHTNNDTLTESEIAGIQELDPDRTRLFVKRQHLEKMRALEARGIKIGIADPQPYGGVPQCQGARKLIFVDWDGVIYTCGLVEQNREYRLGDIREGTFDAIVRNPELPHRVHEKIRLVCEGCDGCPSLIANFLEEEEAQRAME